jgi:hypothetical protein
MKIMNDDMQFGEVNGFQFSGVRPDKLGSTEYTLVSLVLDKTGSVSGFSSQLLDVKKSIIQACRKSPRANFLLFRNTEFNSSVDEVHGFLDLQKIDENQYQVPYCSGSTALYDATFSAIAASNLYAKDLSDKEFGVNSIVFVITDGDDNRSIETISSVKNEIDKGVQNEWLESMQVILIGINSAQYKQKLEAFTQQAQLSQYVDVSDASPSKLAKLAQFVSRSISSQSQALGSGGPSQLLTF